jgi:hypothetical protein
MKQKDIFIIVASAIVSALLSYGIATLLFSGEKTYNLKAPTVEPIVAEFNLPPDEFFNKQSLDPTVVIPIGPNNNTAPFRIQ